MLFDIIGIENLTRREILVYNNFVDETMGFREFPIFRPNENISCGEIKNMSLSLLAISDDNIYIGVDSRTTNEHNVVLSNKTEKYIFLPEKGILIVSVGTDTYEYHGKPTSWKVPVLEAVDDYCNNVELVLANNILSKNLKYGFLNNETIIIDTNFRFVSVLSGNEIFRQGTYSTLNNIALSFGFPIINSYCFFKTLSGIPNDINKSITRDNCLRYFDESYRYYKNISTDNCPFNNKITLFVLDKKGNSLNLLE